MNVTVFFIQDLHVSFGAKNILQEPRNHKNFVHPDVNDDEHNKNAAPKTQETTLNSKKRKIPTKNQTVINFKKTKQAGK